METGVIGYSHRQRWIFGTAAPFLPAMLMVLTVLGCKPEVREAESFINSVGMAMVKLSSGYYVSKFETRQSEFAKVMGYNPSYHPGPDHPVENLTGSEALMFCAKLNEMEHQKRRLPSGHVYSLPTFAQWLEYTDDASLQGSITGVGGRGEDAYDQHLPVGKGEVNRLGLYDLRGNVSEYSDDLYNTGANMVLGACWDEFREEHLSVKHEAGFIDKSEHGSNVGFRCVLVPQEK